jgi:hypothetical protein
LLIVSKSFPWRLAADLAARSTCSLWRDSAAASELALATHSYETQIKKRGNDSRRPV